ncbi:hypothetical protein [Yinghuangia seranimata]|uniref:hypothetical protein n=1 Tax=Yinghuangia seranimata TaxID=408067 RepID=UPI00248B83C4|nr:hypothetical protein [Yinghuangia seranimata]MDI2124919.1 hypothetical protein [Yinghuangia seranimata]
MPRSRTLAVDFDGVIHAYSRGWHDGTIYDPPLPGALDALHLLLADDAVFVFTTRAVDQVAEWLNERGVPAKADTTRARKFWNTRGTVLVTNRKLAAHAYLDDRAIRFRDWQQALAELAAVGRADEDAASSNAPDTPSAAVRLARIAEAHTRTDDGTCAECGHRWPCPTYGWATLGG